MSLHTAEGRAAMDDKLTPRREKAVKAIVEWVVWMIIASILWSAVLFWVLFIVLWLQDAHPLDHVSITIRWDPPAAARPR